MKIVSEINLSDFNFWSGAKNLADKLTDDEFKLVENVLLDDSFNGVTSTEINDMFWFEPEKICDWIGLNYNEVISRSDN